MIKATHLSSCLTIGATLLLLASILVTAQQQSNSTQCKPQTSPPSDQAVVKLFHENCLVAQMSPYFMLANGHYIWLDGGSVDHSASHCENTTISPSVTPQLVIKYDCGTIQLGINHSNDSKTFVETINGSFKVVEGNTTQTMYFSNSTPTFSTTQSGRYYKCNSKQEIKDTGKNVTLVVSNFALEAYRTVDTHDFYQIPEECPLDSQPVSDLVRIGVGVCLVALVIIVLIAYFIGRRRWSERSSYESV